MKKLYSRKAKIIVDILLLIAVIALLTAEAKAALFFRWKSMHCIVGSVLFALLALHIIQHWPLIKCFVQKKVLLCNKFNAWTILCFFLLSVSIFCMIIGFTSSAWHFHNIIGHLFAFTIFIHIVSKAKMFTRMIRG
jgi:hypothetical protein